MTFETGMKLFLAVTTITLLAFAAWRDRKLGELNVKK